MSTWHSAEQKRLSIVFVRGEVYAAIENQIMSTWRNRYTRTFEGRVGKPVRVQVPPSTIKKRVTFVTLFLICLIGEGFNPQIAGSADFT